MEQVSIIERGAALTLLSFILAFGLGSGRAMRADETDELEAIRRAARDDLHESACAKAETFLKQYPDSPHAPDAWLLLGISRFRSGDIPEASKALSHVLECGAGTPAAEDALYWKGECLLETGKHDATVRTLRQFLKAHPNNRHAAQATYALAWALSGAGRKMEGVETMKRLLAQHPGFKKRDLAAFKTGKWLYDLNRYDDAASVLETFSRDYPRSSYAGDAFYWAAESRFETKKWKEARENYERAIAASTDAELTAYSRYGLGWVLAEEGEAEKAARVLKSLRTGALSAELTSSSGFRLAGVLFSLSRFREAADLYAPLVRDELYGPQSSFRLGECRYKTQQYALAIEAYESVPESDADLYLDALDRIGSCYSKLADYTRARKSFSRAASAASSPSAKARALTRLGDTLFNEKKYEAARTGYAKALESSPGPEDREHSLYWLARSLQKLQREEKAVSVYMDLLKRFPSGSFSWKARQQLALALAKMKRFADAAACYRVLAADRSADEAVRHDALYLIAECHFKAGEYDDALRQFETVITDLPGTDHARRALYGRAMCLQATGDMDEAGKTLRSFLRRHKDDDLAPSASLFLANNLYKRTHFDEAAAAYRALIDGYPDAPGIEEAFYWLGWCVRNQGNLPRAAEIWHKASSDARFSTRRNDMLLAAAEAYWKQGSYAKADTIFRKMIGDPAAPEAVQLARTGYADMLQTQGKYTDALTHYTAALDGPDRTVRPKALFGIAESRYHTRDYQAALESYSRVVADVESSADLRTSSRFRMARCLEKLSRTADAAALYRKIVAEGGENAKKAKKLLEDIEGEE